VFLNLKVKILLFLEEISKNALFSGQSNTFKQASKQEKNGRMLS
jgi:hypothetical protein